MRRVRLHYLWILLLVYAAWIATFELVGWTAAALPSRDPSLPLDAAIPLVPEAVWVYQLCYLFPWLPLLVARDFHRLNRAILAILLASAAAYSAYLLLPLAFPRPALGVTLSERLLALEYAADFTPGANKAPSLHVAFAWIVFLACRGHGRSRLMEWSIGALAGAISLSTLLVKQHVLLDVLAGAVWAFASWTAAGRLLPRASRGEPEPLQALGRALSPRAWPNPWLIALALLTPGLASLVLRRWG
ncbi:MAG TPA: phosphatase PAP2 family protein [Myxococcota bacterium]|nr:phosphatase PAP2 family protein [Myxococcota bacterium]HRY97099.1 phosphatase PAP2 family protein [Myxococcota bacterium]HSA23154.1 phosphatase PAP2 family protein [Myxococcota bacterium]